MSLLTKPFRSMQPFRLIPVLTLLLGLLLNSAASQAQNRDAGLFDIVEMPSPHAEAIEQARAEIQILMDAGAPGVSVAVGVDGELVWAEGFGYADIEQGAPVTALTKFRIGSVSKTLTSIALGLTYEQGLIDLDAPVQRYLPDFPEKERGVVTARLLASHRAGVRHYLPDGSDNLVKDHYDDVITPLQIFADDPLIAAPGERYSYSSHGYNLLSAVIQEASGVEYLTLMRNEVFAPLKLIETVADHTDRIIPNRAEPYIRRGDKVSNAPYVDNSYKWAGGGFLSTPSDLVKFGFGVFSSGILADETLHLLLSPPLLPDGSIADQDYGLGWMTFNEEPLWVGHTGGSVGGNSLFMVNPTEHIVVAVVCNMTGCLGSNQNLREIGNYFID